MKIQLSDFSYVDRPQKKKGKALRFALSISVPLVDGNKWEMTIEGCLAFYDFLKILRWAPPKVRWAPARTQQFHWINQAAYDSVLDVLHSHPYSQKMLDNLETPMSKLYALKKEANKVQSTDLELPTLIEGEEEEAWKEF